MEQIVEQRGIHLLVKSEDGFAWTLIREGRMRWYWHPIEGQWTGHPCASPTPEEATAGFDPEAPLAEGVLGHHDPALAAGVPRETPGAADGGTNPPPVGRDGNRPLQGTQPFSTRKELNHASRHQS